MADPLQIARTQDKQDYFIIPKMANRHGLIAGTTGTGKTVTVQKLTEQFSEIGVPVFVADVKGDFSGVSQSGSEKNTRVTDRVKMLGVDGFQFTQYPVTFWDVFGEQGHPIRATVSDMGPLLLSRLLDLNETQTGVLNLIFKIADDNGLLLLDLKDLRSMVQFVGDNAKQFTTEYGMVSAASVGAIQRGLLSLESQGGDKFFGEPDLDLDDLMRTDRKGRGMINVLAADKLMASPKVYSTMLLWLLAELFEELPEVGDLDQPKLVFFFDEAHLLFNEAPKALLDKIEQVVRLIRSKGVGVYFISQNPTDVPEVVLSQLGNRIQHALRAFTAKDQKSIRAAAQTYRENPKFKVEDAITELVVGEALISFLDSKGAPSVVDRAFVIPPQSQIGPITPDQRAAIIQSSPLGREYDRTLDRESAYEKLRTLAEAKMQAVEEEQRQKEEEKQQKEEEKRRKEEEREAARRQKEFEKTAREAERAARGSSRSQPVDPFAALAQSTMKSFGSSLGRELTRGILGSLTGGRRR